jgi:general secretion pathway protein K
MSAPVLSPRVVKQRRKRAKERGVALIMVMAAIAVLTVMLAEFQDDTSAEAAAALADRDSVQAEYMAKSAVNLSRLLIAAEPTVRGAIAPLFAFMKKTPPQIPVWEFSDRILGVFSDAEGTADFAATLGVDPSRGKNLGLPGGRFELVIVDEDSKINANLGAANDIAHIRLAQQLMGLMARQDLNPLFEQKDGTGQFHDRLSTCAAIIDWADVDESLFNCDLSQISSAQNSGVEDAWYQLLPKTYRRKNAPYDSIEELHMVRGVTDDFWATLADPEPQNPKKRAITVWGQGAVNVNTANAQTLLAVVCAGAPQSEICVDPLQMQTFITGVTMARGVSMGAPIFGNTKDFVDMMTGKGMLGPMLSGAMGMKPAKFKSESEFQKSITTSSKMFSIYAVGVKKGYRRDTRVAIHSVVDFRSAPPLSTPGLPGSPSPAGSASSSPLSPASPIAGRVDPNSIAQAMQPSTGGQVVYFRID